MEKIPPELIGRAIQDPEFRRRLFDDPRGAVADTGYELDDHQIEALKALDADAIDEAVTALAGSAGPSKWG
jgi:hypothetical protein